MNLSYTLHEVKPSIFLVEVEDSYDLSMLFCRVQEFYESPNPKYRNKDFCIWDFIDWYSRKNNGVFTYPSDWAGFNLPYDVMEKCIFGLSKIGFQSPYDQIMAQIYSEIRDTKSEGDAYVIGICSNDETSLAHEICHGLYYTNPEYKKSADSVTLEIKESQPEIYNTLKRNLTTMGYAENVIDDEIQAYLTINYDNNNFGKGIDSKIKRKLHKQYVKALEKYFENK